MVHLWLVEKRVADFLLVLIELLSLAITVEANIGERILVEIVVFERGWVTFSANYRRTGVQVADLSHEKFKSSRVMRL